jgi:hypothetical protein
LLSQRKHPTGGREQKLQQKYDMSRTANLAKEFVTKFAPFFCFCFNILAYAGPFSLAHLYPLYPYSHQYVPLNEVGGKAKGQF